MRFSEASAYRDSVREVWVWIAITLTILIFDYFVQVVPVRRLVEWPVIQLQLISQEATKPIRNSLAWLAVWHDGVNRTAELEQRVKKMAIDWTVYQQLKLDYERLQSIQGKPTLAFSTPVLRAILLNTGSSEVMVDKGIIHDIRGGEVVIDASGVVVGRIRLPREYVSIIERPTDTNSRIRVKVAGTSTQGILVGDGARAYVEGVLQAEPLEAGQVLVTDGTDGIYPPNLPIASVSKILDDAAAVTKRAEVELLYQGETVSILMPHQLP